MSILKSLHYASLVNGEKFTELGIDVVGGEEYETSGLRHLIPVGTTSWLATLFAQVSVAPASE